MQRFFLRAKIHLATLTGADPDYEGSIAICPDLLALSGIAPGERVDVYNRDNGERLTTYAIAGAKGEICLNGAAALKGEKGQRVIIACYCLLGPDEIAGHVPAVVVAGPDNRPK
jgi:aspartate 1-decarboxylase